MLRLTSAYAAATLVAASLALPAAAHASTIYPPSTACQTDASAAGAGETIAFGCDAETFGANEAVTITVTGENGAAARFGMVGLAITTGSAMRTSTATGALEPVAITLPSDATGVYNIEAISATSAGGTSSTSIASGTPGGLPNTGGDAAALALWIGGAAVLLGGGGVALGMAAGRRRGRSA